MSQLQYVRGKWRRQKRRNALSRAFADRSADVVHIEWTTRTIGMFAQLSGCIQAAEIAERSNKRVVMRLMSDNYRDTDDDPEWFGSYFINKAEAEMPADCPTIAMRDAAELPSKASYTTLSQAKGLFDRHYAVRPDILAEVDALAMEHGVDENTLAIHYRGTDKHSEAPEQAIADVLNRVERYVDRQNGVKNVFVASDVADFVEAASKGVAGLPVCSLDDAFRSADETPVHTQGFQAGNKAMGREAILNCLMLARCRWLCRTSSFLSAWSAVFNPDIKVAMLNKPYDHTTWLPETIIMADAEEI